MQIRFVSCALAIAVTLPITACSKKENATPPAPSASAATQAQPAAQASAAPPTSAAAESHSRGPRGSGPSAMLFSAARTIELKDPQKATLTTLEAKLREEGGSKTEFKEYEGELATEVRAGKLDTAKLKAKQEAVEKVAESKHDREMEAIAGLHAALEPAQRKAVTASVRSKMAEREQRMAKRREREEKRDPAARVKMRVERMTKDLSLDAAQQKVVETALSANPTASDPEAASVEAKKRAEALLAAFEQDKFEPKKLVDLKPKKLALGRFGAEQDMLAKLVPSLKPEQREKLAGRMDKQGPRRGHGPGDSDDHDDD